MAINGKVQGLILKIGGDTSGLLKSLKDVDSATSSLTKELKGINSLLKLDPKNTELLSQKQTVLNNAIKTTEEELEYLKQAKEEADKQMAEGTKINEENYRYFQREIINTERKLSNLKNEASNWTKAGDALIDYGKKLDNIAEKADKLGNKLTTGLTLPLTGIGIAGLKYNAEIETLAKSYETFLEDSKEAEKVVNQIKNDASKTPFDVSSLVKANQMLISTGENAEESQKTILALGEAITATGGGNDELTRMASNLQQVKNAGKATAMDIRQFAYAGIDIYGLLADYTGKTTAEVKEMDVSYEALSGALQKASQNGGKYYNAMSKASETLTGQTKQLTAEVKDGVGDLTKSLMPTAKKVVSRIRETIKWFDKLSDKQKENIVNIGLLVAGAGPALKIGSNAISMTSKLMTGAGTLTKAIGLMKNGIGDATGSAATLAKVMQTAFSPTGAIVAGTAVVAGAILYLKSTQEKANVEFKNYAEEMKNAKNTLDEYNESIDENTKNELSQVDAIVPLKEELKELVDENGNVKKGYEGRVSFILNELNNALGTEYELNGNLIDGYKDLQGEIDNLIEKKKAEILLNAKEEKYRDAFKNREKALDDLSTAYDNLGMSIDEAKKNQSNLSSEMQNYRNSMEDAENAIKHCKLGSEEYYEAMKKLEESGDQYKTLRIQKENLDNLISAYDDAESRVKTYVDEVKDYENEYAKFAEGKYEEIGNIVVDNTEKWTDSSLETIKQSIRDTQAQLTKYTDLWIKTGDDNAKKRKEQAQKDLEALAKELKERTKTVGDLGQEEIEAWKTLAESSYETYSTIISEMPEEMQKTIQEATNTISAGTPQMQSKANEMATKVVGAYDKFAFARKAGVNVIQGYLDGLSDSEKQELLKEIGIEDVDIVMNELKAGNLSEQHGKNILQGLYNGLSNGTLKNKILGVASGLATAVNKAFTGKSGWDEHSPSKKMKGFAENYIKPISTVMQSQENSIVLQAKELANKLNSVFENQQLQNYERYSNSLNSGLVEQSKTIFTTPQIVFNVQELDEARLQQCLNYVNRKFGSAY